VPKIHFADVVVCRDNVPDAGARRLPLKSAEIPVECIRESGRKADGLERGQMQTLAGLCAVYHR
jgi:hypothetical protein